MIEAVAKRCRGCGEILTSNNDSEAHVIPNALGGRLKSKGIICRSCNTALDAMADNALIGAFGDWPTLLDIPRDRGSNPNKMITTRKGRNVRLEPSGELTAMDAKYDVDEDGDNHKIQISAGNMKTARQLLMRAKKQFPHLDTEAAMQYAQRTHIQDDDELRLRLNFGPRAVFGGVVTAIWLYLVHVTGRAFMDWVRLCDCIKNVQSNGGKYRYLTNGLPGLNGPAHQLGHKIIVRSIPRTGKLIAYVEILGVLKIGGIFADAGGPSELLEHIYAYDVVCKKDKSAEFTIDPSIFESVDWESVGLGPGSAEELRQHFKHALENELVPYYASRFTADAGPKKV